MTKGLDLATGGDLARPVGRRARSGGVADVETITVDVRVGAPPADDAIVRAEHVAKRFAGVVALRDATLALHRGEVVGLVGDNASGKSTLVKVIAGLHRPDAGRVVVRGRPVVLRSVDHARSLGIACVFQDLALVDQLSVWQNLCLRRETVLRPVPLLARRRMRAAARVALDELGVRVGSVDAPVGQLSGGQRQAVAVARGLRSEAEVLLLDEPIAAMGAREAVAVLDALTRLRDQRSVAMLLVAHDPTHVRALCDRVERLEDGVLSAGRDAGAGARAPRTTARSG